MLINGHHFILILSLVLINLRDYLSGITFLYIYYPELICRLLSKLSVFFSSFSIDSEIAVYMHVQADVIYYKPSGWQINFGDPPYKQKPICLLKLKTTN